MWRALPIYHSQVVNRDELVITIIIIILNNNNICHAPAGTLAIFTYQGQRCIWYGRVIPYHCLDIIQQLVVED